MTTPKASSTIHVPPNPPSKLTWIDRWQRIARRIRVPLGFGVAALYLVELFARPPRRWAILASLLLVVPGLWLRGYAAGYVKKNRELTVTGPYAHTRNPLYLGSMLIAAGFALALLSWTIALALAVGFTLIYVPVIASEERFLRATFPGFDAYCRQVPRLIPRLIPQAVKAQIGNSTGDASPSASTTGSSGSFSFALYSKHREYNALIGGALLYLSLIGLRPILNLIVPLIVPFLYHPGLPAK